MAEPEASVAGANQATQSPIDHQSASRTFFTTIDVEAAPKKHKELSNAKKYVELKDSNAGPRIMEHHKDLTNLAMTLDQRMQALLNEHEKDFFLAYKTYMYNVQREIKLLRMKADHEEAKTREDTKIKALEGELDWFMTEALRLDELCKGYKKEVDKWKSKAEALDEDRRFLEDQIKGAKRQNKILRAAAERARSSAYSAMMVTKSRTENLERSGGAVGSTQPLALTNQPRAEVSRRPASAGASGAVGVRRALELRSQTPDEQFAPVSASSTALVPKRNMMHDASAASIVSAATGLMGGPAVNNRSLLGNEAEERYVDAIQHLKDSIVREQQTVRMLQAARATTYSHKSELEEFFLKCVDESRKELTRKRHLTMHKEKDERERVLELMLSNEDVLVCLYEKLFPHRTGIARSLGGVVPNSEEARLIAQTPVVEEPAERKRRLPR